MVTRLGATLISVGVLQMTGALTEAFEFMDFDFGFQSSEITHCSFNPTACILLCGTTNPGCDMTGQCQCTHHPSSDAECEEPSFFDLAKCNTFNCHRRGHRAYVCSFNEEKICVCSPPKDGEKEEGPEGNSTMRVKRRPIFSDL